MKRLAAGLLTLAIATGLNTSAHAAPAARALATNGDVAGEITSATALNYNDGSRSQLFSLQLNAGQAVSLKLDGPLKGSLSVFHRGLLVGRAECGCDSSGTQLSIRADKGGEYLVAVSGSEASSYGPFQLNATPIVAYDGKPLTAGGRITDWLIDQRKTYTLQVDKPGLYTVNLESDAFDTVLELSGNGLELEDDDGGSRTNSRLLTPLQPGTYTLTARAFSQGTGAFYLGVEQTEFPDGVVFEDGSSLPLDGTVNSIIGTGETRSFVFSLPDRRRVQFDASSRDLDTFLTVQGADFTLTDDDGGSGLNSRLSQVLDPGEYNVSVRSMNNRGGLFQLVTSTAPAPDGPARPVLTIGREVTGQLVSGVRNLYTLEIPRKGQYVISMNGNNGLDGMITLMRDGHEVASQDDSPSSLDPLLEIELEAGRYVLMAHSYDSSATGSYRLLVRRK
ncbi:ABC transporter substrate-binding protein [Stenotrophomonas mori]|uniref:ABC transporter substrate-binding protein n=1 Tax=Stenotrophomonas mori TaxID=2871096 RepID=A0ABT0SEZ0_9GAMM|nr:ABC transporter substrate-binding protein [Stenotrophomonas mori]MCL7713883.1 ABC transporter substrate-binding protein [Stenotrophomonas mori]